MSDTLAALAILPTLAALVLVLECSRIGCTKVLRLIKRRRDEEAAPSARLFSIEHSMRSELGFCTEEAQAQRSDLR